MEYASLSINENQKLQKFLLNIPVNPKSFRSVSSFRASHHALNVRADMVKVISQNSNTYAVTSECNAVISPQQGEDSSALIQENNTRESLYVLVMSRTRFRVNPHSIVA